MLTKERRLLWFDRLTNRFDRLTNRFDRLTNRFDRLTNRFDRLTDRRDMHRSNVSAYLVEHFRLF
jgi:hypothetical protein